MPSAGPRTLPTISNAFVITSTRPAPIPRAVSPQPSSTALRHSERFRTVGGLGGSRARANSSNVWLKIPSVSFADIGSVNAVRRVKDSYDTTFNCRARRDARLW